MLVFKPEVIHGLSFARFLDSLTMGKDLLYASVNYDRKMIYFSFPVSS